jgi:phosphoribosylanthranilate isomerase
MNISLYFYYQMNLIKIPRIKICCIKSVEEARMAINYGASAIGLVSEMPGGPGIICEEKITEIAESLPPSISSFLLTSKQNVNEIVAQQKRCKTNTIQLCDSLLPAQHEALRAALPGISIVQVVHVTGEESVQEAVNASQFCHGLLLDSGNQKLKVKILGGTGKTHNWKISSKIVGSVDIPVFLAGGLNPSNVKLAIKEVKPFGIDACSGLRENHNLIERELIEFIYNINHWFE